LYFSLIRISVDGAVHVWGKKCSHDISVSYDAAWFTHLKKLYTLL